MGPSAEENMFKINRVYRASVGFVLLGLCGSMSNAMAHTLSAYLMPETFDLKNPTVTVQSALTVEKFYEPSRVFKASYQLTDPSGQSTTPVTRAEFKRYSVLELELPAEGTYRLRAVGTEPQTSEYAQVDGQWLRIRAARPDAATPPQTARSERAPAAAEAPKPAGPRRMLAAEDVPAHAPRTTSALIQQAELYVSRGAPGKLPAPIGKGFELVPLTVPNDVYVDSGFEFRLQQDGQVLPGVAVEVFRGSDGLDPQAQRSSQTVTTDAQGKAKVSFEQPGVYLLTLRYPQAPADNRVQPVANNVQYSLSLQVAP